MKSIETNHLNFTQKIDLLIAQLDVVKKLVEKNISPDVVIDKLNLDEAIKFMASQGCYISKSLIYKLTSTNVIPVQRCGRKLIFDRNELLQWCKDRMSPVSLEKEVTINLAKTATKKM
ncbi:MAG: hypothetical protein ABI308_02830 [Mucilaginibacter sp.]